MTKRNVRDVTTMSLKTGWENANPALMCLGSTVQLVIRMAVLNVLEISRLVNSDVNV